jgi:hypothetical protein
MMQAISGGAAIQANGEGQEGRKALLAISSC